MDNTSPIQTGYESHPPGNGGDGGSRSWQSPPPLKGVLKKKGSVKDGQAGAGGIYNLKGGRKGSSVRIVEHDDDTQGRGRLGGGYGEPPASAGGQELGGESSYHPMDNVDSDVISMDQLDKLMSRVR